MTKNLIVVTTIQHMHFMFKFNIVLRKINNKWFEQTSV